MARNTRSQLLAPLTLFTTALLTTPAFSAGPASTNTATKVGYVCPRDPDGQVFETPGFCGHDERIRKGTGLRVALLLIEGAQLIDYTGPMEILGQAAATVFTVAPTKVMRTSSFGLKVTPDYDFDDAPPADVLLVPGGEISEIVLNAANKAWLVKRVGHHPAWSCRPGTEDIACNASIARLRTARRQ